MSYTAARPPNDWWVTLSYDKSDVTELAEPPDVLHGWEAGAGVVAVVEHRRLRAVRQLHMLGLTQRAATYVFLTSGLRIRIRIQHFRLNTGPSTRNRAILPGYIHMEGTPLPVHGMVGEGGTGQHQGYNNPAWIYSHGRDSTVRPWDGGRGWD